MSKLEDLVPPLELCKLIPAGEFEDSAFIWVPRSNGEDYQLSKRTAFIESAHKCYPAPTLEEIMGQCRIARYTEKRMALLLDAMLYGGIKRFPEKQEQWLR